MTAHGCCMHGTEPTIDWNRLPVSQTEHHLQVYIGRFLQTTNRCPFPFPGCPWSSCMWNGLRLHFNSQHWGVSIRILEENQNPSPIVSAAGTKSHQRGWTPGTMHLRTENTNRSDDSAVIRYSADLRQVCYRYIWMKSPWHCMRTFLTSGRKLSITTAIGRRYIRTWGNCGVGGGWLRGFWKRRGQQCGPVEWCIMRWLSQWYCTAVRSGWWWGRCWWSWRGSTTRRPGGSRQLTVTCGTGWEC